MLCDFCAGWVSGMVGFAVGYPMDTIKVHQQLHGSNALKTAAYIFKKQRLRGFYRGMGLPLLTSGVFNALFFGIYGPVLQKFIRFRDPELKSDKGTYPEIFFSGSIAGGIQLILYAPVDLVKVKLQNQLTNRTFAGPVDCVLKIYRQNGFKGFYRGIIPLTIRDIPGCGIWILSYEYFRRLFSEGNDDPHSMVPALAGGLAGVLSWVFVIPFDVLTSKMQADNFIQPVYKNMRHVAQRIFKNHGVKGFFRGFMLIAMRAFPVSASSFFAYQFLADKCKDGQRSNEKAVGSWPID